MNLSSLLDAEEVLLDNGPFNAAKSWVYDYWQKWKKSSSQETEAQKDIFLG